METPQQQSSVEARAQCVMNREPGDTEELKKSPKGIFLRLPGVISLAMLSFMSNIF
tara:strand:+ start:218 stop:385 length:168 start_codon:yes stop_codon:yes gene_type:complete